MNRRSPYWLGMSTTAAGAFVLVAAGCGPSTGSVTGTVRYQGRPVVDGYVMLVPADGDYRRSTSSLIADGRYAAPKVSLGKKTVVVMDAHFNHDDGRTESVPADATLDPPTATVMSGPQVIDIQALPAGR